MICLSADDVSNWIRRNGQVEVPLHAMAEISSLFHIQFYSPATYADVDYFVRRFFDEVISEGDILFQIVDCFPTSDSKRTTFQAWWKFLGETRDIEKAPGCLVQFEGRECVNALFSLSSCFGWTSCVYANHEQIILFNWEGDIFDVWTCSSQKANEIQELVRKLDFKIVPKVK